jgi:hypothetical protein
VNLSDFRDMLAELSTANLIDRLKVLEGKRAVHAREHDTRIGRVTDEWEQREILAELSRRQLALFPTTDRLPGRSDH